MASDPELPPDEEEEDEDDSPEEEQFATPKSKLIAEKRNLENLIKRLSQEQVSIRVHDVIIRGNTKTKDSLLLPEIEVLKKATTLQELLHASSVLSARLNSFNIFDAVKITLDSGPAELPGTANVVVQLVETKSPFGADLGIFNRPEPSAWNAEGSLKLKNLLGYGDIWDGSWAYGWDQTSEISAGISLPRFKRLATPVMAKIFLHSQDWLKASSYEEKAMELSLGLISTKHHDLAYDLTWRTLTDPSQMSSRLVRMQLGHSLISSLRYKFTIDRRNSPLRPTRGYAFVSHTKVGGLTPDSRSLRFLRQEFDLRYALPLGFYNTALNLGLSVGAIFPWGNGFMDMPSPLCERFFLCGQRSPVCTFRGPRTLLGFKSRGVGPTEPRRMSIDNSDIENSATSAGRDVVGGDLAITAFADLSFNLPVKLLRDVGIHGHLFACAGNLTKLTENEFRNFSLQKFRDSFRTSAGAGIVVPTKFFRMEINYCYILKKLEHDWGKTGIQFSFSSP